MKYAKGQKVTTSYGEGVIVGLPNKESAEMYLVGYDNGAGWEASCGDICHPDFTKEERYEGYNHLSEEAIEPIEKTINQK